MSAKSGQPSGKVYDPVFLFMLFAVFLAVASSFALRAVVSGLGPSAARAAALPADDGNPGPAGAAAIISDSTNYGE